MGIVLHKCGKLRPLFKCINIYLNQTPWLNLYRYTTELTFFKAISFCSFWRYEGQGLIPHINETNSLDLLI